MAAAKQRSAESSLRTDASTSDDAVSQTDIGPVIESSEHSYPQGEEEHYGGEILCDAIPHATISSAAVSSNSSFALGDDLCAFCRSFSIETVQHSVLCIQTQKAKGCHACYRKHCWSTSPSCLATMSSRMSGLIGPVLDDKPRPFQNALGVDWGAGSCYINAALQTLFSSSRVRWALANIVDGIWTQQIEAQLNEWSFCLRDNGIEIQRSSLLQSAECTDSDLALTFAAAMRGRDDNGTSLRGRPLFPALCLKKRYRGNQEDSAGFLMECLQSCDSMTELFKGRYCRATKECSTCGHSTAVQDNEDDQIFTSLQLDCRCRSTGDFFPDIQTALNASFREDLEKHTEMLCSSCGACWSHKRKEVQDPPKVLLLQVHQWDNAMKRIPSEMPLKVRALIRDITSQLQSMETIPSLFSCTMML